MSVTLHSLVVAASSPSNGTLSQEHYYSHFILPYDGFLFPFEKNPKDKSPHFIGWWKNTRHYGLILLGAYLLAIFVLQFYMKHRKPFRLQIPLFLWNMALGVFSMLCSWRALMDLFLIIRDYGFHSSVCSVLRYEFIDVWHLLFVLSKFVELGDTFFIVLRKRPLIFLHLFHHTGIAFYGVCLVQEDFTLVRWVTALNTSVHACMYPYFALRALNVPVPAFVRKNVTRIQVAQFLLILFGIFPYIWYAKITNIPCLMSIDSTTVGLLFAIPLTYIFVKYYYDQHIKPSAEKKQV